MKPNLSALSLLSVVAALGVIRLVAAPTDDVYVLGPDSAVHPGVPQGKITDWEKLPSTAYPETLHDFCVYVPAQYDPATPAALMIFQDGQAWVRATGELRTPAVFDNLIYRREMPVTIAVFINPGRRPDQPEASQSDWGDHSSNRPQEYNSLDDKYARVITDELLPVLEKRYNLSKNAADRAIGGASSGGIAAFTVAWHRPDQFGKVLSTIGSFVDLRGGHVYPDLIRQSERKPLRVYLLDGVNDNRGLRKDAPAASYDAHRDWHAQNIRMLAALTEKGYDVNFNWGIGTHSSRHAGAMLPEMLRWLWRDYPRTDDPHDASNRTLLGRSTEVKNLLENDRAEMEKHPPMNAPTEPTGRYAAVNGLQMYYEIHGRGGPLVLIHGGGSTIESTFGRILPELARTHQVIAVELQAHGHTPDIGRPLSFEQDADDVAALLQQLHIENADILGFSNGGTTALQIAIRHPQLVHRLVLASANYRRDGMPPGFFEGFQHASLEKSMPQPLKDAYLKANPDPKGLQTMFDRDVARMAAFKDISTAEIKAIQAPTLVINGDADVVRPEHALELSRTLPHAKLAILPGAHGEYIGEVCAPDKNSNMPALATAMIEEFLKK